VNADVAAGAEGLEGYEIKNVVHPSQRELIYHYAKVHAHAQSLRPDLSGNQNGVLCLVITEPGKTTARGGAYGYTLDATFIFEGIWLDPDLRGLGFGAKLYQATEEAARKRGCVCTLASTLSYAGNHEFAQKMGLQRCSTVEIPKKNYAVFYYFKNLD
jgi:GNAT superfamily N-acetyltransferase